jgi:hypothetical protein
MERGLSRAPEISLKQIHFSLSLEQMFFRRVTAVLLGVLLQVTLCGASIMPAPAETCNNQRSCCCSDLPSCPCVESGGDEKPSIPAIPSGQEQQSPVIVATDPEITSSGTSVHPPTKLQAGAAAGSLGSHRGVALRVSFCRYTI